MMISVQAENVCSFERFSLKLKKRGLVWIGGDNQDTSAADSNGSGKSNILKTICWAAYGQTLDGKDGDEIIRSGEKMAKTILKLDGGWIVTRTRRKGAPRLKLELDGAEVNGDRKDLQERINDILGMDWETFRHVVIYGQDDRKRFIRPEMKDQERKEVLHKILRTGTYAFAHEFVKKKVGDFRRDVERHQGEATRSQARIDEHDPEATQAALDEWNANRTERRQAARDRAKGLADRAKNLIKDQPDTSALDKRVAELEKKQAAIKASEGELERLEGLAEASNELRQQAHEALRAAVSKLETWDEKLEDLEGDACPICSSPLDSGAAANHVAHIRDEKSKAERDRDAKQKAHTASLAKAKEDSASVEAERAKLKKLRAEVGELADVRAELAAAKGVKARAKEVAARAQEALNDAKAIAAEVNPHIAALEAVKAKLESAKAALEAAKLQEQTAQAELAHWEFWAKGFSPSGLPSFVLDAVMPFITERANYYLDALADGDITMEFSTQRELKSGDIRDQLAITWQIEGNEGFPPSGGQWKKMELSTEFAMMDLVASRSGARPELLLLDEALDGLDSEGRSRILTLLHRLRSVRKSIFVISHEADMAEVFERQVTVQKRDGVSALVDAA